MTAHPLGLAGRTDSSHVNRVAKFTQRDAQDPAPDVLTQIKREVDVLDQLETTDAVTWAARVAALPARFRVMFQGGTYNRLRNRYQVYGFSAVDLLALLSSFVTTNYTVSAWLRLAQATTSGGKYTVIPDILNVNPISQSDTDRQPAVGTSANGFPIITWDGTDVLPWAVVPANNATAAWGVQLWIKPTSNIATRQRLIYFGPPGSTNKLASLDIVSGGVEINCYLSGGVNGRQYVKANCLTASVWQSFRFQFNGAGADDTAAMKCFVNEVEVLTPGFGNLGVGGAMTNLNAAAGTITIGGREDQDAPSSPLLNGFQTGPNIFVLSGILTAPQGVSLMNFEKPT